MSSSSGQLVLDARKLGARKPRTFHAIIVKEFDGDFSFEEVKEYLKKTL